MAYKVFITPSAVADLEEYADYIADDSLTRAQDWLVGAWDLIFSLNEMPGRFAVAFESPIDDCEIRSVPYFSHRIIYRIHEDSAKVEVLRIWHVARRDLNAVDLN